MQLLETLVGPSLPWCSGSWKLTKQQRKQLNSIQRQMVMKMLNFESRPGEQTAELMKRLNSKVTDVIIDSNISTFREFYCRSYFRWVGASFSILSYDPNHITYNILRCKDLASFRDYSARDARGRQGHVGSINVWRFETSLFKVFEVRNLTADVALPTGQDGLSTRMSLLTTDRLMANKVNGKTNQKPYQNVRNH